VPAAVAPEPVRAKPVAAVAPAPAPKRPRADKSSASIEYQIFELRSHVEKAKGNTVEGRNALAELNKIQGELDSGASHEDLSQRLEDFRVDYLGARRKQ
jgi:hypothetical protein